MSSPCHIELILSEKEEAVKKEVIFFLAAKKELILIVWLLLLKDLIKIILFLQSFISCYCLNSS